MIAQLHSRVYDSTKFNYNSIGCALIALPVLVHVWLVYRFSTNMPYLDDYTFIVDSVNLKLAHLTPRQLLTTVFYPHGEHVIVFARLTAMIDYLLEGELNFRTLFFVGNSTLLGTAWLLYRMARQDGLSVPQTVPMFYLLFQPQYYENTITWAICALQHIPALFFAFWAFYLLSRSSARSFLFSLPLAFLAIFSNGNGLAVLVAGFLIVLLRRQPKQLIVWLVFTALCGWLYHYLSQFSAAAPVSQNLSHPLRVLGGFFLMSGSMGLLFTRSLPILCLIGMALTFLFAVVIGTTLVRYTGYERWLKLMPVGLQKRLAAWSVATIEPVSLALIAGYLYPLITLVGIAFAREQGWHYGLLLPRFIWFATVAVVIGYLLFMLWLRPAHRPIIGRGVLIFSFLFNAAAYWLTFDEMLVIRQLLSSDFHNWRENKLLITLPANKRSSDSFYATLMEGAIREKVYRMPGVLFKPNTNNQAAPDGAAFVGANALIAKDSSFSLDDRQYRYLTIADGALPSPEGLFTIKEAYLLLRSNQHTFIWSINQSNTKLSQFLLTGRSLASGPIVVVMAELLPPAIYQAGICYAQDGQWTTRYSSQQLTVTGQLRKLRQ